MVSPGSDIIRDLAAQNLSSEDVLSRLRQFASEYGWRPSDQLTAYRGTEEFCTGHLVVEHGFDRTAVLSFMRSDHTFVDLDPKKRRNLLSLSYNNLIDWHLMPERDGMRIVFNRVDPAIDRFVAREKDDAVWRSENFDKLIGRRPNPNVAGLDNALISNVSFWKRAIRSDLPTASSASIASLINLTILLRAAEDHKFRNDPISTRSELLLILDGLSPDAGSVRTFIEVALTSLQIDRGLGWVLSSLEATNELANWDFQNLRAFVESFYKHKLSPYPYDFNLISKHALSRIYEHYVSILRDTDSDDLVLFRSLPEEIRNKDLGSIYTPQYIARFFARYLKENRTPRAFRSLRTLDPACGSGIFLRTLLEMQCDHADESGPVREVVPGHFDKILGIDIDVNACHAARLSLALLHLVLVGSVPESVNIVQAEAIQHLSLSNTQYDAIIANPPFIKWDGLPPEFRDRIAAYMAEHRLGKTDLYLAFLKSAIEHCVEGGIICFVLPQSFLLSNGARSIRQLLANQFAIRIIADLSDVSVFEETGAYVILLVAEKSTDKGSPATIVRCREFVGLALQDALNNREGEQTGYSVFSVDQRAFTRSRWTLLNSAETSLQAVLENLPKIDEYFEIRQGVITGKDDIFIRPIKECPKREKDVWKPLLPDREMRRFAVPQQPTMAVFMPFGKDNEPLAEGEVKKNFPETWDYLRANKSTLAKRSTVTKYARPWWEPSWPRNPEKILVPKIVSPHLILLPRFAVDPTGKYAVSRAPYFVPKVPTDSGALLRFMCAVLNSSVCHWQLATQSHKYSRGYLKLESTTLRELRVPDPSRVSARDMNLVVRTYQRLFQSPDDTGVASELDVLISSLFGLTKAHNEIIGIDD